MFIDVKNRVPDFSVGLCFCNFPNGSRAILPRWNQQKKCRKHKGVEHYPGVCGGGVVLPGKGIIRGRVFENDATPTKTYDVLKMLTNRNYTMFFKIENDSYR